VTDHRFAWHDARNLRSRVKPDQAICVVCALEERVRGETAQDHATWSIDQLNDPTDLNPSPRVGLLLPRECPHCGQSVSPQITPDADLVCPRCTTLLDPEPVTFHRLPTPIPLAGFPWASVEQVAEVITLSGVLGPFLIDGETLQDTAEWHFALRLDPPASTSQSALKAFLRLPGFSTALAQAMAQAITQLGIRRPPVPVVPTPNGGEFLWLHRLSRRGYGAVLVPLGAWDAGHHAFADWLAMGKWAVGLPYFRRALPFPR